MSALRLHVSCLAHFFCAGCFPCWFMGIRRISPVLWRGRTPLRKTARLRFTLPVCLRITRLATCMSFGSRAASQKCLGLPTAAQAMFCSRKCPRSSRTLVRRIWFTKWLQNGGQALARLRGAVPWRSCLQRLWHLTRRWPLSPAAGGRSTRCLRFFWSLWSRCS